MPTWLGEIAFDPVVRMMATLHAGEGGEGVRAAVKELLRAGQIMHSLYERQLHAVVVIAGVVPDQAGRHASATAAVALADGKQSPGQ